MQNSVSQCLLISSLSFLFYTEGKDKYQPLVDGSPNPKFIREKILKPILRTVEFVETLFLIYRKKRGEIRKTHPSTEDLVNWSNQRAIGMGMGNTCYSNLLPFMMD